MNVLKNIKQHINAKIKLTDKEMRTEEHYSRYEAFFEGKLVVYNEILYLIHKFEKLEKKKE